MERKSRAYPVLKPTAVVEWTLICADRPSLRRAIAEKWLEESPYTNYRYNVEICGNGSRVYLLRPTWLNKGFDFQVNLEGFRSALRRRGGQTREMPSHDDVIYELKGKVAAQPEFSGAIFQSVCDVYDCAEPRDALMRLPDLSGANTGLPPDQLLAVLKWLFIEQDLTYWLQTGRDMLMGAIEREVFGLPS